LYQVVVAGGIQVDIDHTTLPPDKLQTAGFDPSRHNGGGGPILDGYCFPVSPTDCCQLTKKKVKIGKFLNDSGDPMMGMATIDNFGWVSQPLLPPTFTVPSDGVSYSVTGFPGSNWLYNKMETMITVGFLGTKNSLSFLINVQIATNDWHIKTCGQYKVRIVYDLDNLKTYTKFNANCRPSLYGATRSLCWELIVST